MNFKKKAIIGIAAGLFAVATVFNMNISNDKNVGDVSLEKISVMANALPEGYTDDCKYAESGWCAASGTNAWPFRK